MNISEASQTDCLTHCERRHRPLAESVGLSWRRILAIKSFSRTFHLYTITNPVHQNVSYFYAFYFPLKVAKYICNKEPFAFVHFPFHVIVSIQQNLGTLPCLVIIFFILECGNAPVNGGNYIILFVMFIFLYDFWKLRLLGLLCTAFSYCLLTNICIKASLIHWDHTN